MMFDQKDADDHCDDVEEEFCSPPVGEGAQIPFSLRGGSSAFTNRSQSVFDCLDSVAQSVASTLKQDNVIDGVFARPLAPCPKRKASQPLSESPIPEKKKAAPDYEMHPERWTHYTLEDVMETSDQENRKAAHQFLSSLKQRREQQESSSDPPCYLQQKILFSRPSSQPKDQAAPQLIKGKVKETRLRHLEEEEEEEAVGGKVEKSEEEQEMLGDVDQPDEKKPGQKESSEEEIEDVNPSFTSFRKNKHKNYRKTSRQEDS